jgi:hypothetical protein
MAWAILPQPHHEGPVLDVKGRTVASIIAEELSCGLGGVIRLKFTTQDLFLYENRISSPQIRSCPGPISPPDVPMLSHLFWPAPGLFAASSQRKGSGRALCAIETVIAKKTTMLKLAIARNMIISS